MKEQLTSKLLKTAICNMVHQETEPSWPDCWGWFYQAYRPVRNDSTVNIESNECDAQFVQIL